jgi:hypothetical protein
MSRAMVELANNSDLRVRMGQAGRERMVEHFDTGGQVRKLEEVLQSASCVRAKSPAVSPNGNVAVSPLTQS